MVRFSPCCFHPMEYQRVEQTDNGDVWVIKNTPEKSTPVQYYRCCLYICCLLGLICCCFILGGLAVSTLAVLEGNYRQITIVVEAPRSTCGSLTIQRDISSIVVEQPFTYSLYKDIKNSAGQLLGKVYERQYSNGI